MRALLRALLGFFGLAELSDDGRRREGARDAGSSTIIGSGVTLKGEIRGDGPLTVRGRFEGDIVLDGVVHVGPGGQVDANVDARAIVIAGVVRGNLSAHTKVEVLDSGAFTGTVKSGAFSAADGARVKGDVWIEQAAVRESPA